jgi:hypothetical protein
LISQSILHIFAHKSSELSYEVLYRTVYNIVTLHEEAALIEGVDAVIKGQVMKELERIDGLDGIGYLEGIRLIWKEFCCAMNLVKDVMLYAVELYGID